MGWCSGTEIFDKVAQTVIDIGLSKPKQRAILEALRDAMVQHDWDCQDDSDFSSDPLIGGEILGTIQDDDEY
jgi:hypothetical protein